MQSQQFQDLLNAIPVLTSQQRNTLINALSEQNSLSYIAKSIEESFVRAPRCPHCGSEDLQRWGDAEPTTTFPVQGLSKDP